MAGTAHEEAYVAIEAYFDEIDERMEQVCNTVLEPRLDALEADRKRVQGFIARAAALAAGPAILIFFSDFIRGLLQPYASETLAVSMILEWWTPIVIAIVVLAVVVLIGNIAMPGLAAHLNYRRRFKHEVVSEVFRAVTPDGTYQPDHHVSQQVVDRSGFFSGNYQTFNGDDLIRGRVGSIEYEASEIRVKGTVTRRSGRERNRTIPQRPNLTDFGGTFFHFALGRAYLGHTIIEPETIDGRLIRHRKEYQQLTIDDEPFTAQFRVYSTNPAESQQILTPTLRTTLLALCEHFTHPPIVGFVQDRVFVAVHEGRTLFEPTIAKQASYGVVSSIAEFFATPPLLIRELGLDASGTTTRFASAAATIGGGSILTTPAEETFVGLGTVTGHAPISPDKLMDAAMPQADDKDAALPTPPASRVRMSPMTGESLEVSYGIHPGYLVRILWALVLAPFAIGGLARLIGGPGAATFDAIVARLPIVVPVTDLAMQWPLPFVGVVLVVWLLPTWSMLHVPRATRIDREGVHVKKRLWPIGKLHPMDRIGAVQVNEKYVMLSRKNTSIWRRFVSPAPPMRSTQDARWLAAHMRRAMERFGGLR